MARTDENDAGIMRCMDNLGGVTRVVPGKPGAGTIGQNRRALRSISQNILRAPLYPCAVTKRALTEKHAITTNKNPPIPVHRPVTRKYVAQLSNKQQKVPIPVPVQTKPTSYTAPVTNNSEDCLIIEAEEYDKAADDFSAPMFVQHTEAILEDIDRMDEEVEMEDVDEEELIVDIDSADKDDQLAVVEYVDEIYANYKKEEGAGCVSPTYMSKQYDINERMRGILIDWLIEVHYKFELMEETLYLTVNLIDRFLTLQAVIRKKLQLVGITALLLACKYEEVSVPVVEDLIVISDRAYSRQEVLDMEKFMINTLQFHLSVRTPYVFMRRFLKAAESDKKLELLAFYIIELCLVEYGMLKFPPSLLAAAAVFTAQCTLSRSSHWSKTSEKHSNYSEYQLLECSKMMVTLHQNSGKGKLTGVHRKYSTSKYGYAARSEPAHFILNLGC